MKTFFLAEMENIFSFSYSSGGIVFYEGKKLFIAFCFCNVCGRWNRPFTFTVQNSARLLASTRQ